MGTPFRQPKEIVDCVFCKRQFERTVRKAKLKTICPDCFWRTKKKQEESTLGRPIDYIIGRIEELDSDRSAGWEAFYKVDYENEKLKEEIARLKKELRENRRGRKTAR